MNDQKHVVVIGAGPAGMTAAYELSKTPGIEITLLEAGNRVGGLSKTVELWGQLVDIGPHRFFSKDRRVNELWLEVVGKNYQMIDRQTRILYKSKFYDYPLRPLNALFNLGPIVAIRCVASYLWRKISPLKDDGSLEIWVRNRFGDLLFNIFFKTYTEKVWGIPTSEIDSEWAAQRIKKLSLMEAIKNALFDKITSARHATLVDKFAYPNLGTGYVYDQMAKIFVGKGGKLFTDEKVIKIQRNRDKWIVFTEDKEITCDEIISTMPLTLLTQALLLDDKSNDERVLSAVNSLRFRNTTLVYLEVNSSNLFPDQWLYIHSPELKFGRVTNFRNWSTELYKDKNSSILTMEYWSFDGDEFEAMTDDAIAELAKKEMCATGLVQQEDILNSKVFRIKRSYPVYDKGYTKHLDVIQTYIDSKPNLQVIGRYGSFKYNNQDHSILMGLFAAQNIANGADHNLWEVNTDYDYQESAIIGKDGLEST